MRCFVEIRGLNSAQSGMKGIRKGMLFRICEKLMKSVYSIS